MLLLLRLGVRYEPRAAIATTSAARPVYSRQLLTYRVAQLRSLGPEAVVSDRQQ
jgi:hypothetical protein